MPPRIGALVCLAVLVSGVSMADAQAGSAAGVITVEPGAESVTIVGKAVALSEGHYDVAMSVRKSGTSGTTNTTQKGAFDLDAGESADVARLGVSFASGDSLTVKLEVRQAGKLVWQTTSQTASE